MTTNNDNEKIIAIMRKIYTDLGAAHAEECVDDMKTYIQGKRAGIREAIQLLSTPALFVAPCEELTYDGKIRSIGITKDGAIRVQARNEWGWIDNEGDWTQVAIFETTEDLCNGLQQLEQ